MGKHCRTNGDPGKARPAGALAGQRLLGGNKGGLQSSCKLLEGNLGDQGLKKGPESGTESAGTKGLSGERSGGEGATEGCGRAGRRAWPADGASRARTASVTILHGPQALPMESFKNHSKPL